MDVTYPTITQAIELQAPNGVSISPLATRIAFTVKQSNWKENRYDTHLFVDDGSRNYQLTRNYDVGQIEWFDEDRLLATMSRYNGNETDKKKQLYYFPQPHGEPIKLTDDKNGISSFKIRSQDEVVFRAKDPEKEDPTARKNAFGQIEHREKEESADSLYYTKLDLLLDFQEKSRLYPEEENKNITKPILPLAPYLPSRSIEQFLLSPDGIYLTTKPRDDLYFQEDTTHHKLEIDLAQALEFYLAQDPNGDKSENPTFDHQFISLDLPSGLGGSIREISPDGDFLLFKYSPQGPEYYRRADLFLVPTDDILPENMENLTNSMDRDTMGVKWSRAGIFVSYFDYSRGLLAQIDEEGTVVKIDLGDFNLSYSFDVSDTGMITAIVGSPHHFTEVLTHDGSTKLLTDFTSQLKEWSLGTVESIRWKSRDGTEIEGVLRKPPGFDPEKQYPVLFVVHGGPTWLSLTQLFEWVDTRYYPVPQFVAKDMIVVKPNYRGSIGRGEDFKMLYKGNAGIGDLKDLESCIDYLGNLGFVDVSRVGCMGWSQGGYISAFVGTHSDRFSAVSMGAGISSWYTYYITNDIRQWARYYLLGTPQQSPEQYEITAPISAIDQASTPFLIQHGENDQRVPLANALEMQRNLEDRGVPVELFIFKNFGHGITKPREHRAAMLQNLVWFCHHLLGEELNLMDTNHDLL